MSNGNERAYPISAANGFSPGLTIRELFAAMALQGMIAGRFSPPPIEGYEVLEAVAVAATMYADALLVELEKEQVTE